MPYRRQNFLARFLILALIISLAPSALTQAQQISSKDLGITINLEKSASFSIRSDTWFYDNQETLRAEVVVTNFSENTIRIESPQCLTFEIIDNAGIVISKNGNNDNEFCVPLSETDSLKRLFTIEPHREYYFHLDLGINILKPGHYKLKATLADTQINSEKKFFVIDPQAKCLGIPEITANALACPFNDEKLSSDYLDLNLKLNSGYLSNQDEGLKQVNLSLKNKTSEVLRFAFLNNCLAAEIRNLKSQETIKQDFTAPACQTNYINIGSGFLKSNRIKVLSLQAFEVKPIYESQDPDPEKSTLVLPIKQLTPGEYEVKVALKDQPITTQSTAVKVTQCPAGFTVNSEGKCVDDPQLFYQDKIAFDIEFEKIPEMLGEEITAYIVLRNVTNHDIAAEIAAPDCLSLKLYQKKELLLREIKPLPLEPNNEICPAHSEKKNTRLLKLAAQAKHSLPLKMPPTDFLNAIDNQTPQAYDFVLEGKINGNIRTKLKPFSLLNFVAAGGTCGGPLNILCKGENLVCSYPDFGTNSLGVCAIKKSDENYFLDTKGHFAEKFIEELFAQGIVEGYAQRYFKPDQEISRAEFMKIIVKALKLPLTLGPQTSFTDVDQKLWYAIYIETAKVNDIVEGYRDPNGILTHEFRPEASILRQEAIKILVKSFQLQKFTDTPPPFSDVSLNHWYYPYLFAAYNSKVQLIEGFLDNTFRPAHRLTRAEAAKIIKIGLDNQKSK